ncbi:MAG: ChbG/HpnK family deacetylase, partial [Promethearchaeia archaeon]
MDRGKPRVSLIVTADDLGISPERDEGIFQAFSDGIVTNASLLVNGCSAREAGALSIALGSSFGCRHALTRCPVACLFPRGAGQRA